MTVDVACVNSKEVSRSKQIYVNKADDIATLNRKIQQERRTGTGQSAGAVCVRGYIIWRADEKIAHYRCITVFDSQLVTSQHVFAQSHGWHPLHKEARARCNRRYANNYNTRTSVAEDGLLVAGCASRVAIVAISMCILEALLSS